MTERNQEVMGVTPAGSGCQPSASAAKASSRSGIPNAAKSDPSYADGYFDAFHGDSFDTDRAGDEPYCYGFEAGDRAIELFEKNGFRRDGNGLRLDFALASAMSAGTAETGTVSGLQPASATVEDGDAPKVHP